jgi:hypothetical protein
MFADIQNAIRKWSAEQSRERTGPGLRRRVAHQITPYLGSAAAHRVLGGVSETGDNLLSTVEPVLALFLGVRAASRVVDRVVETVLVRN